MGRYERHGGFGAKSHQATNDVEGSGNDQA
jgi:hypothetical protein